MTLAPRPGLVIFDNDGVLVDSERIANAVMADILTGYGVPTTTEGAIRDYMGGSMALVRAVIRERHGRDLPAEFEDTYHDAAFAAFRAELTAVPGCPTSSAPWPRPASRTAWRPRAPTTASA